MIISCVDTHEKEALFGYNVEHIFSDFEFEQFFIQMSLIHPYIEWL